MRGIGKVVLAVSMISLSATAIAAEPARTVRFAKQFGIGYLPMAVMEAERLVEKQAAAAGVPGVTADWVRLTGGVPINDALLAGSVDFASGGVGPMLTIWARTRDTLKVRGLGAINSMPIYLNTIKAGATTLKDLADGDKIALPAVKVSVQAVTLMMAAEKAFGAGKHSALDHLTVSMSHPDGMANMMSGQGEITAHFTSAPFMYQQLQNPRVKRLVSSYEVLGGPHSFNLIWGRQDFYDANPKITGAVLAAMEEAMAYIAKNPRAAAELWAKSENSKLDIAFVEKIVRDPENRWTVVPERTMAYASFMHQIGSIKVKPESWKDYFHPLLHARDGS